MNKDWELRQIMAYEMEYIDSSMSYYAWKTKFIESFAQDYLFFKSNIDINKLSDPRYSRKIVAHFMNLFFKMIRILQKKLKEDQTANLKFYTDIIDLAEFNKLINDKKTCFEIIKFSNHYFNNRDYSENFKFKYIEVLDDFNKAFSILIENEGKREREYVIIDNSEKLWGLKKKHYKNLIECFKSIKTLEIVRIFGSRVTTDYKEFSDIDLILEGNFLLKDFLKIKKNILNIEIPYIRDVNNIYSECKPFIYRNALRSNIFYERKKYFKSKYISFLD